MWNAIDWQFMSEESEDEDNIIKHPLTFRSDGNNVVKSLSTNLHSSFLVSALNKLVSKLDDRAHRKEGTKHGFKRKPRVVKSPSKLSAPGGAPSWSVSEPPQPDARTSGAASTPTLDLSRSSSRRVLDLETSDSD